tara:strand:- start:14555 stop:15844 length:1290 start_codon:yes stop_codon:yes gene_type:complete
MKYLILTTLFFSFVTVTFSQCQRPDTTFENNVYYYSANLNWSSSSNTSYYKIRYKEINSSQWQYKNNIDSSQTNKTLNNLISQSIYIWQIRTHCDTNNINISSWTPVDSFITTTNACQTPTGLTTSAITHNSAQANWDTLGTADRYKIHYRIINTNSWLNLNLVSGTIGNTNIPVLQQNTTYEWQIMAYHDSTLNMGSLWSISEVFTTGTFVYEQFDPNVTSSLQSNLCNSPTEFEIIITQLQNEPDIGTSTITTDGGYFDIGSISFGDSVGYANFLSLNQNIESTLTAGLIVGPNYAIINSYDTSNSLIGFFAIENTTSGVRVSTTSPNDGNNYTSGYTSNINFTNLFVNPNINGDLNILTELNSESGELVSINETIFINCTSNIYEISKNTKEIKDINLLGQQASRKNIFQLKTSNDGSIKKIIIIK